MLAAGSACTSGSVPPSISIRTQHRTPTQSPATAPATRGTAPHRHPQSAHGVVIVPPHPLHVLPDSGIAHHPIPTAPRRIVHLTAADGRTYRVKLWEQVTTHHCANAGAFTTVNRRTDRATTSNYLRRHPCTSLTRLLATSHIPGEGVGYAEDKITLRSRRAARGLGSLIRRAGGELLPLFAYGYGLPNGPQSEPSETSFLLAVHGKTVTTLHYWYLVDSTPARDPALEKFARDVYSAL